VLSLGKPEQALEAKLTAALKPLATPTVIVVVPERPGLAIVTSGGGGLPKVKSEVTVTTVADEVDVE
jgi:hypothetical protein